MEEKNIEKKEVVKSETQEIKRPWQGNFLLGLIPFGLFLIIIFNFNLLQEISRGNTRIIVIPLVEILVIVFIFGINALLGLLNGLRWSVITTIAFSIIFIIEAIFKFINIFFASGNFRVYFMEDLLIFVLIVLFYLCIVYFSLNCLKHPFYNQKKVQK